MNKGVYIHKGSHRAKHRYDYVILGAHALRSKYIVNVHTQIEQIEPVAR